VLLYPSALHSGPIWTLHLRLSQKMWIKIWVNWWVCVCNSDYPRLLEVIHLKYALQWQGTVQNHGEHRSKELARYSEDPHSIDKICAKVTHKITPHQLGLLPLYK
jgi:hypothetical protein